MTDLLRAWADGRQEARDQLIPLVYADLRRTAAAYLRRERPGGSIQATEVVHEVFLRLVGQSVAWRDRAHFFGIAARVMRQILVDHARTQRAAKRGRGVLVISLDEAGTLPLKKDSDLVALDDALQALEAIDPRQSQVVELRFFGGLSIEEAAEVLGVSPATVKRDWTSAKAWLLRQIERQARRAEAPR